MAWGAAGSKGVASCPGNSHFSKGDGCDRDGDGIQGAYGTDYHGRKWDNVIDLTNDNKEVAKVGIQITYTIPRVDNYIRSLEVMLYIGG